MTGQSVESGGEPDRKGNTEDNSCYAIEAVRRSVLQWRFIDSVAARIDDAALREAQMEKDAVRAYELVYAALGA